MEEKFGKIDAMAEEVNELKEQLYQLKENVKCPKCGAYNHSDDVYCSKSVSYTHLDVYKRQK